MSGPGAPVRVTALTGGRDVPSARFRVEQLVPALEAAGLAMDVRPGRVSSYPPRARWLRPAWLPAAVLARVPDVARTHGGSRGARVTLLQREFVTTLTTLEWATARPRVLDVDDAIWLNRGGRFAARLARMCDVVVAGNAWLAEWFGRHCDRVEVLPTAIDTRRFAPAEPAAGEAPAIGWIGTSSNFSALLLWRDGLCRLLADRPGLRLRICADRPPPPGVFPAGRVEWVRWSPGVEVAFLQSLAVGLMPLPDTPWSRGKCSFKMLQYLSCAVPAVVSPVGMNVEVLGDGAVGAAAADALQAEVEIARFLDDRERRLRAGEAGRRRVLERYGIDVVAPRLAAILRDAATGGPA